jgi:6,7-dimethyl-8-ribityllumazine synthase
MSSAHKNLSTVGSLPSGRDFRFVICVSKWNTEITDALLEGARTTLLDAEVLPEHIFIVEVPGSFELPLAAKRTLEMYQAHAAICLGCVIQGETPHFDFVCNACANGLMEVGLQTQKPVIFGVLTTLNQQQALDRSGGKHGNKGVEAAATALQMLQLQSR